MPKYIVTLSAEAWVVTVVEIAGEDRADAQQKAIDLAQNGGVVWSYDGVQENTEEATGVTEVE